MNDWIAFEGQIIPMEWGESVYTVLPVPDEVYAELSAQGAKRVEVELNDHPFNMALSTAPALDGAFIYTGKSVLSKVDFGPGEIIDVRMRKADPNLVEVPEDIALAILQGGVQAAWEAHSPGKRRGFLHMVTSAKRAETRVTRITKLIAQLKAS